MIFIPFFLKSEKKFILEAASKRFHTMYNTCPVMSCLVQKKSPGDSMGPGAWGLRDSLGV